MPEYRIENRVTKEIVKVEAPFAQTACEMVGWAIGDCYVKPLREGPFSNIKEKPKTLKLNGKKIDLTKLSGQEREAFLEEHFYYEISMLTFAVHRLFEITSSVGKDQSNINMALEILLLHVRSLREFFYAETRQKDDARPEDFVEDTDKWERERPEETDLIKEVRERANKELAHLTYKRYYGTPPQKQWNYEAVQMDFLKVVKVFLENVPQRYWGPNLHTLKQMIDRHIT